MLLRELSLLAALASAHADLSTETVAPRIEAQAPAASEEKAVESQAVKLSLDNKSDVMSGLRGGSSRKATFLGALTLEADLNFERAIGGPKGLTASVQTLALYGQVPSNRIGDTQGADQIAAQPGFELYQAWLQQSLFGDRLSVLAGLHDLNSEFYSTDSSTNFLNTAFAIGPELVKSGKLGPSVWPATALGTRVRGSVTDTVTASLAVYDGIPGDPDNPGHSGLKLRSNDGVMAISELAATPKIGGLAGKYAIGAWGYDQDLADLSETDDNDVPLYTHSFGAYLLIDQKLYAPAEGDATGLSGFLRLGWADGATDPIALSGQSGLLYTGLFRGRAQDQLGLGVAAARASSHYRAAVVARGGEIGWYESAFELTYRARIASWLWVQPDLQWIAGPGMSTTVADAFVAGGRLQLTF